MNNILNKKILITGGGGFIGSNLARLLLLQNNKVDLFDIKLSAFSPASCMGLVDHKNCRFLEGNILDAEHFCKLDRDYDYVVHAAAILGIKRVCAESLLTLQVNIIGTENCLNYCTKLNNLQRLLLISTSEVYGPDASFSDENANLIVPMAGKRWCYAASKIAAEQLAYAYNSASELPFTIVRPFNVYGPYRTGANAITDIAINMIMDRPVLISGNGKQNRAWCYIDDFVKGLELALAHESAAKQTFNIGNPNEVASVLELAGMLKEITGSGSPVFITGSNESDVVNRSPKIDKAQTLLGFMPQVELRTGLEKTVAYIKSRTIWNGIEMPIAA